MQLLISINSSTTFWQYKFRTLSDSYLNDRYSNPINFLFLVKEATHQLQEGVKVLKDVPGYRLRSLWVPWCIFSRIAPGTSLGTEALYSYNRSVYYFSFAVWVAETPQSVGAKFNCGIVLIRHLKGLVWNLVKSFGSFSF